MSQNGENFSMFVSNTLKAIGYKWWLVKWRRENTKQSELIANSFLLPFTCMTLVGAGSKREGVSTSVGGDDDWMTVFDEVIATDDARRFEYKSNLTVLQYDLMDCPPGYALLSLEKHEGGWYNGLLGRVLSWLHLQVFLNSCIRTSHTGQPYVSSEMFIHKAAALMRLGFDFQSNGTEIGPFFSRMSIQPRTGPSIPVLHNNFAIQKSYDNVLAITCQCPVLLEKYINRPRKHGWPPECVLRDLYTLDAHVVPVGCKRSVNHNLEWRICFTKAEIRLIECLTEAQILTFILLKIFAKDVLKNVCDVMTSYVMKNVILWMAELTPLHNAREDTTVDRFLDCLFFLRMCVKLGKLPNYMIQERNLFSSIQFTVTRKKLLSVLNECLHERSSCLFRCDRLKSAMLKLYKTPEEITQRGHERDRTEMAMKSFVLDSLSSITNASSLGDILQYARPMVINEMQHLISEKLLLR